MFCVKCGNIIQPGMAFCTKCGTPVKQKASAGEQQNEAENGTEAVTSASGQAEAARKTAAEATLGCSRRFLTYRSKCYIIA